MSTFSGRLKASLRTVRPPITRPAPPWLSGLRGRCTPAPEPSDLLPLKLAKEEGYGTTLYLDCAEKKYVEEFSVSNFIGIDKDGAYCTPAHDCRGGLGSYLDSMGICKCPEALEHHGSILTPMLEWTLTKLYMDLMMSTLTLTPGH